MTRDPKITEFDVPSLVNEDVGGFDVSVDHAELLLEVVEGFDGGNGHFPYDVLRERLLQRF
jgi:hypothetical protein